MDLNTEAKKRNLKTRILVTRLRYLGDVIITTPVIKELKNRYPDAEVYYLVEADYACILKNNPYLDGIIPLERGLKGTVRAIAEIRRMKFVAAVDLFYNPRSANILFLSGVPVRLGGNRKARRMLYTHNFAVPPEIRSSVRHHLYSLKGLDCKPKEDELPKVYLSMKEKEAGKRIIEGINGVEPERNGVVALHPGGTYQSKRWPAKYFALLADMICESFNVKVAVIKGPGQEDLAQQVNRYSKNELTVLPLLPIRTLASVIYFCEGVVANDGGILHLSVALGKPTTGIFGPTEPDIWFPYEGRGPFTLATDNLECAPCHKGSCETLECLRNLEVKKVYNKYSDAVNWSKSEKTRGAPLE